MHTMKRMKYKSIILKIVILIALVSFHPFNGFSSELPQLSSNSVISLIVCSPSPSPEGNFGHAAIRVQDKELKIDVVFNYGLYDREQSFFFFKMLLGKLESSLEGEHSFNFIQRYRKEGRGIKEYYLILTLQERQALWEHLNHILLSENRFYKFNFTSNNCTTQTRDLFFDQLKLRIPFYQGLLSGHSYRDVELESSFHNSWIHLLFNMIIGANGDKTTSFYQNAFYPDGLLQLLKAVNENERTIIVTEHDLLNPIEIKENTHGTTSVIFFISILLLTIYLSYIQYKKGKVFLLFDRILFFSSGILGVFLLLIMLFSEVAQININFNIMWALPTNIFLAFLIQKNNKRIVKYWTRISLCTMIAFPLLSWYFKQYIPIELYLFATILLIRMYFYTGININKKLKL